MNRRFGAVFCTALLFFSSAASASTLVGFSEEEESKIQNDLATLHGMGRDRTGATSVVGLPATGSGLAILLTSKLPLIVEQSHPIKGCSTDPKNSQDKISCNADFEDWPNVGHTRQYTTHHGIRLYTPYLEKIAQFPGGMRIAVDKLRHLDVVTKNHAIVTISRKLLEENAAFETKEAASMYRLSGYLSAARVFDSFVSDGLPLKPCDKEPGLCDPYRNGAASHAAAFLLYAASACESCTNKDRSTLLSFALRSLAMGPPDILIQPRLVFERLKESINRKIFPHSIEDRIKEDYMRHRGLSKSL